MKCPQFDEDFIKASERLISIFERGNKSFGRVIKKMKELWPDPEFDLTKN